jgi:hypothetical protein
MRGETTQEGATLLDVLIDGFEKNEIMDGFHWRDLPMPDEARARGWPRASRPYRTVSSPA